MTKAWGELATRPAARIKKDQNGIGMFQLVTSQTSELSLVTKRDDGVVSTEQLPFLITFSEPKNLSSSHNLGIIIPRYENVTLKLEIVCVSYSNQREK